MSHRPISAAYLERKLRAVLGVQGANPLPDLMDAAQLLTLEQDRPEWLFPGGELLRAFLLFTGIGGAANLSVAGVENLPGSGQLVILERINAWVSGGAANRVAVAWLNAGVLAPNGGASARDGRDTLQNLNAVIRMGSVTNLTPANLIANGLLDIEEIPPAQAGCSQANGGYIIPPGRAIVCYEVDTVNARSLNTAITVSMAWRQRPFEGTVEIK